MRIDDLPLGEQIVTTVKHEKNPSRPPSLPPLKAIFYSVLITLIVKTIFKIDVKLSPQLNLEPPNSPDTIHPNPRPDYPDYYPPDYYPPNPQFPEQRPKQSPHKTIPPDYLNPSCSQYPSLPCK
jgi:hypothetical protein